MRSISRLLQLPVVRLRCVWRLDSSLDVAMVSFMGAGLIVVGRGYIKK